MPAPAQSLLRGTVIARCWPAGFLICALLPVAALAREYFVSPRGADTNAGTRTAPWLTIAKANASLRPGDVATFLDGNYAGTIEPAGSGTPGATIGYRSENPLGAVLQGGEAADSVCVRLQAREHIVIEGFWLRPRAGDLLRLDQARFCTIRQSRLEGGASFSAILCTDSHYNRYEDLECGDMPRAGTGHVVGDLWANKASSHNVFLRVHFYRVGHCPLNFWNDSPYNIVRQCTFDSQWGRNFEFFATPHLLVEDCVITNGFDGSGSADGRAKLFIVESIFRRNLIHRNYYGPLVVNAYRVPDTPTFRMDHSRIYHNTWAHNYENGFEMVAEESARVDGAPPVLADNVLKNNNFAGNDPGGDGVALRLDPIVAGQTIFQSNNLHGNRPNGLTVRFDVAHPDWAKLGVDTWSGTSLSTREANDREPDRFRGNIDVDPQFVDAGKDDYRLKESSACRDAGRPLAVVAESGAGRELPVDDARWFFDGFDIPGETGDLIYVGDDKKPARVLRADTKGRKLILDRDLAWRKGEGVSLPYAGSAPDLGAYEQGAEAEPWYRAPKVRAGLRLETMATADHALVRTDFEAADRTEWFYYWNFTRQRGTNVKLDDATAAEGNRSLQVFATGPGAVMACDIKPREWDVDRFPTITFDYRIPRGVPVGLWLHAFPGSEVGRGAVCIGGTRARDPGPYRDLARYELVDDDAWHQISIDARAIRAAYPNVKLLQMFRFYTSGNGQAGERFWFDRFTIQPK